MNRQKGVSLISLLIGLLVSMIVVLAMLMIYRNTIQAVMLASEDARSDGERVSGFLAAHLMLHDAGFGFPDGGSYGKHLLLWSGATLASGSLTGIKINSLTASGATGNAITWRWAKYIDDDDPSNDEYICEGLFAGTDRSLWRISSSSTSCDNIDATISWSASPLIEASRHSADTKGAIMITVEKAECQPFGIGTGILGDILVTLSYEIPDVGNKTISSTTCLANFSS